MFTIKNVVKIFLFEMSILTSRIVTQNKNTAGKGVSKEDGSSLKGTRVNNL